MSKKITGAIIGLILGAIACLVGWGALALEENAIEGFWDAVLVFALFASACIPPMVIGYCQFGEAENGKDYLVAILKTIIAAVVGGIISFLIGFIAGMVVLIIERGAFYAICMLIIVGVITAPSTKILVVVLKR